MSTTGITTDVMKNSLLIGPAYTDAGPYLTLLQALTLASPTTAGAVTFTVDLAVAAGDTIVFDQGQASFEQCIVGSFTGGGPYVVTPTSPLTKAHVLTGPNAGLQSHMPKTGATVHEVGSITRSAANWGNPSSPGVVTSSAASITVPINAKVGSLAVMSAATSFSVASLSSATDTITETATALANDDMVIFTNVGATPLQLSTIYYVVSKATNSFKVAATQGGTAITLGTSSANLAYTKGIYLDSTPVAGQNFPTSQPYVPVFIETVA